MLDDSKSVLITTQQHTISKIYIHATQPLK